MAITLGVALVSQWRFSKLMKLRRLREYKIMEALKLTMEALHNLIQPKPKSMQLMQPNKVLQLIIGKEGGPPYATNEQPTSTNLGIGHNETNENTNGSIRVYKYLTILEIK